MCMQLNWKLYVVAAILCVVSFVTASLLPTTDVIRSLITVPGVGALFIALFQLLRDEAAHVKALEIHDKQQLFNVGVTSHMANVAFDKHVEFSETYIKKMQEGLTELFRTGASGRKSEIRPRFARYSALFSSLADRGCTGENYAF